MRSLFLVVLIFCFQGCVQYTLVEPGRVQVENLSVETPISWNKAPGTYSLAPGSQRWTNNGHALDDIIIIPGVESGKTLFKTMVKANPMPSYDSSMLPPEVAEFVEASLNKYYGETQVQVEITDLAPYSSNGSEGVKFGLSFSNPLGFSVKGKAVAIQRQEELYVVIFTSAAIHYYDAYINDVDKILNSIIISRGFSPFFIVDRA